MSLRNHPLGLGTARRGLSALEREWGLSEHAGGLEGIWGAAWGSRECLLLDKESQLKKNRSASNRLCWGDGWCSSSHPYIRRGRAWGVTTPRVQGSWHLWATGPKQCCYLRDIQCALGYLSLFHQDSAWPIAQSFLMKMDPFLLKHGKFLFCKDIFALPGKSKGKASRSPITPACFVRRNCTSRDGSCGRENYSKVFNETKGSFGAGSKTRLPRKWVSKDTQSDLAPRRGCEEDIGFLQNPDIKKLSESSKLSGPPCFHLQIRNNYKTSPVYSNWVSVITRKTSFP